MDGSKCSLYKEGVGEPTYSIVEFDAFISQLNSF